MPNHPQAPRIAGLLLCVFAFALRAFAQTAASSDVPFIVNAWNTEQGLPDSEVVSIVQSHDGYIWLGTLHGLVRFDGIKFTVFNENKTPGLNSDRIVYLFEDKQNNLWIGAESSGLSVIQNGKIKNFIEKTRGAGKISYAWEEPDGIWFYSEQGLLRFHDGKMDFYQGVISPELYRLALKIDVPSQSGGFWRINGNVQKLQGNQVEKDFGPCPWGKAVVKAACEDKDGNLIVGTVGDGVYWYKADGGYWHVSTEQGLSSQYVLSLRLDREGDLWVGTDSGGLDRIKRKTFDTPAGLHSWDAQSLAMDNQGGIWSAFNFHGMSYLLTNNVQDFPVGQYSNAWTVLVDKEQRVWAGTLGEGLFQLQTNQFRPAPGSEFLGLQIFALFQDRRGLLWAGTQDGLGVWDGQFWKLFKTRDGLSGNSIRAIAQDAAGNLWVGTENNGLNFFKDGKFISILASDNGLPGNDISCLYVDKENALWVGTSAHGLARYQNGKWTRYSTSNGLASDSIAYIIEDDLNNLWIGSNAGLMRILKKSLDDYADGAAKFILCRTYGKADGLPTRECSAGSQPAAVRSGNGWLWFPTTRGCTSVNPAALKPHGEPPVVMIESILVNGHEQKTNRLDSAWQQSIVIPPGGEELEIHYTALNFSAPDLVRFKYWLEGHETTWTEPTEERVARYPKLPPGNYTFHVQACNQDNVWSSPDATLLAVTVQPQIWQTVEFRVVVALFLLGLVAAIVRYISTQKLHRQLQSLQQREALERERARIARDLHDQLGANLTQVALLAELAEADKNEPAEVESHAQQISATARETTRSLDEIVWAANPANDTIDGLINYAGKYAQEYITLAGLRCRAELPTQLPAFPIAPEVRYNAFLAFKEAVHNVVKHAQATEAKIRLRLERDNFILEVEDNGRGLGNQPAPQNRNGLRNMKKRMEDIHGEFSISAGSNGGTLVRLTVPLKPYAHTG
jgi:signal transduction histidine kinase/ligand-binding sensor domain-containing protein